MKPENCHFDDPYHYSNEERLTYQPLSLRLLYLGNDLRCNNAQALTKIYFSWRENKKKMDLGWMMKFATVENVTQKT